MARKNSNLITSAAGTIADGSIGTAKLADESIDTTKLADEAVTSAKIDSTVASTGKAIAMAIVFG